MAVTKGTKKGDGAIVPYGLSKSTSLAVAKDCDTWVDDSELGVYILDL